MEIRTLENTPIAEITNCFNAAFSDYFVPITATEASLQKRFHGARVNYGLSFGAFEGDQLVAIIMTGDDLLNGKKTAYNAGTGVIPEFRGRRLVDQLYREALPVLREAGFQQCSLEVITQNTKAIKAYQNVGFEIARTLHCFKGDLRKPETEALKTSPNVVNGPVSDLERFRELQPYEFSWDNRNEGIRQLAADFQLWQLLAGNEPQAYCILNPASGQLAQFGFSENGTPEAGKTLFAEIAKTVPALRINNVDSGAAQAITLLQTAGLENHLDQYEMFLPLN